MKAMGHNVIFDAAGQKGALNGGSTDMGKISFCMRVITDNTNLLKGNVTYEVPGFHGAFYIPADGVNHTPNSPGVQVPRRVSREVSTAGQEWLLLDARFWQMIYLLLP